MLRYFARILSRLVGRQTPIDYFGMPALTPEKRAYFLLFQEGKNLKGHGHER